MFWSDASSIPPRHQIFHPICHFHPDVCVFLVNSGRQRNKLHQHNSHPPFPSTTTTTITIIIVITITIIVLSIIIIQCSVTEVDSLSARAKMPTTFFQVHICYFRDKCVVFARYCKFANLTHYNMQYVPCNRALLAQETPKKPLFLPKDLKKSA